MSITVERRYRVTTPNGTASDMSEEEARALALGLLAALGLAPGAPMADAEPVAAMVAPPAQLPSGPEPPKATTRASGSGRWHDGLGRLVTQDERDAWIAEERAAGGADWARRAAARCEVSVSAVYLRAKGATGFSAPRPKATPRSTGPSVITAPVPRDAPTKMRTRHADADWSDEDDTFLRDERAKGKTWVLLGELLGRTASECKSRHDGLPPLRVTA